MVGSRNHPDPLCPLALNPPYALSEVKQALKEFSDPEYLAALLEARKEIREGKGVPAEEVYAGKGL